MLLLGSIITLIGSLFLLFAAIGVLRMPDVFNRMQAGTKASTLGTILFLIGLSFTSKSYVGKVVILILFIIFTNPISANALGRAAHFIGIKNKNGQDDLKTDKEKGEIE
jgi:multicomponent Na+:H+ antiporter subunit G